MKCMTNFCKEFGCPVDKYLVRSWFSYRRANRQFTFYVIMIFINLLTPQQAELTYGIGSETPESCRYKVCRLSMLGKLQYAFFYQ